MQRRISGAFSSRPWANSVSRNCQGAELSRISARHLGFREETQPEVKLWPSQPQLSHRWVEFKDLKHVTTPEYSNNNVYSCIQGCVLWGRNGLNSSTPIKATFLKWCLHVIEKSLNLKQKVLMQVVSKERSNEFVSWSHWGTLGAIFHQKGRTQLEQVSKSGWKIVHHP